MLESKYLNCGTWSIIQKCMIHCVEFEINVFIITDPPIHWVLGLFPWGLNGWGTHLNTDILHSAEVKNEWSCTFTPTTVFKAYTGTTLSPPLLLPLIINNSTKGM